jgi:redox-sensitive bicupin YhaK (pirin superfamily)
MVTIRRSAERGHFNHGWLDTYHTFSFGRYVDRRQMGFRSLRVINEDRVAGGAGFGEHPHEDMEILTYVLSGRLTHRDSLGNEGSIGPGDVQRMSAGRGILHSEFNGSKSDPVHLLQIWILPEREGLEPSYEQKHFSSESRRGRFVLLASPDGAEGSVRIHQDARLSSGLLRAGEGAGIEVRAGRHAWVQVARGAITVNGVALSAGDGASISGEPELKVEAAQDAEVLVFDLA